MTINLKKLYIHMKRPLFIISAAIAATFSAGAQGAIDAYRIAQPDMKGTARFMSMGGAFGALGGDLSSLSQNPAGIGVYRSNDIGLTVDLDLQNATAKASGASNTVNQTKFLLNNAGGVLTLRLPSQTIPNLNLGFTYNKSTSFNRRYAGYIPNINTSVSNYIAGVSNGEGVTMGDVTTTNNFDPYNPNDGGYAAPWISILGYDSYLIDPSHDGANPEWYGQYGNGTSGSGHFAVTEQGSREDYNIVIGGNIANMVYWGMNFSMVNLNYTLTSTWGESLDGAFVPADNGVVSQTTSDFNLNNYYNVNGNGFNYQLGVIFKPVQEFRIGLAMHTPTWFNLTETYGATVDYEYGNGLKNTAMTNQGKYGYNDMSFKTPWKFIGSLAGVFGSNFIISADYEWCAYDKMKFSGPDNYGYLDGSGWGDDWDWGWDPWYAPSATGEAPMKASQKSLGFASDDPFWQTNSEIRTYYQATHTVRIGAEYRVTPAFSVRAGYSYSTSPVRSEVKNNQVAVWTSGTLPSYRLDNHTQYITCGLGYKYQHFYADLAYIFKTKDSTFHAFTPDVYPEEKISIPSPLSKLTLNNSQVVLTAGFRF